MKTREEALNYALSFAETYQDAPFRDQNWQLVRVKKSKKAFLWTYEKEGKIWLNVKVNPETRDFWRAAYDAVIPGWHQNKEHWNTIILDGTIPEKEIRQMIAESYDLVTDSPTKRIYEAVKKIPKGHVATYGQVAQMAGNPKMARAVGSGSRAHSLLPGSQRERRTRRRICFWRGRRADQTVGRRRYTRRKWTGGFGKIWDYLKRVVSLKAGKRSMR